MAPATTSTTPAAPPTDIAGDTDMAAGNAARGIQPLECASAGEGDDVGDTDNALLDKFNPYPSKSLKASQGQRQVSFIDGFVSQLLAGAPATAAELHAKLQRFCIMPRCGDSSGGYGGRGTELLGLQPVHGVAVGHVPR